MVHFYAWVLVKANQVIEIGSRNEWDCWILFICYHQKIIQTSCYGLPAVIDEYIFELFSYMTKNAESFKARTENILESKQLTTRGSLKRTELF